MTGLMKRFVKAVLGCALVLAWGTIRGPGDDPNHESASRIPATVWEGGGARLAIDAHTSSAAKMRVSFSQPGDELSWTLSVDGETVDEQSDALEKPLQKNYAFALQAYFDDYPSGELGDD